MFGRRLRLALRACLVSMPVGGDDQLGIRRKSILRPDCTLLAVEATIVVVLRVADGRMIRVVGLDQDLRGTGATAGPAGHLGEQGECALGRAVIRKVKAGVRIDDADGGHPGQVESLGHQLRTHQHVCVARDHLIEDQVGGIDRLHHVTVEPNHAGGGEQRAHLLLDALGTDAEALDVSAAAGGAAAGHRLRAAAVVTLQPPQRRVVDKGDATVRALAHLAAVAAEDEGCQAAAIQEENRLLPAFERSSHRGLELPAERAELSAGDLLSHVDHRDRWQRPALGAVWQLEQVRAAR